MKNFEDYISETEKRYMFRAKIAQELDPASLKKIEIAFAKYGVEDVSKPKRLPIALHNSFEHLGPVDLQMIDIVTKYPCTPTEAQALLHMCIKVPLTHIMVTTAGQEVIAAPIVAAGDPDKAQLDQDLPKNEHPQLLADLEQALAKKNTKYEYTYAAPKTAKATTTNDIPQGMNGPIGSKRQNEIPNPFERRKKK
jgi:hypothetical protein